MKNLLYIFTLLVVAGSVSCRKEQPEMKPILEDCSCANEVSADFLMEEQSGNNPNFEIIYTNTDTTFAEKYVRFRPLEKNAEYHWYLGLEELTTEQVVRFFPQALAGMNLPVTLVVKKKPNTICFPNDDGYDSITKFIKVYSEPYDIQSGDLPLEGYYRFFSPQLNDSIDIHFDVYYPLGMANMFDIYNFDGLGNNAIFNYATGVPVNYREIKKLTLGNTSYGGFKMNLHNQINGVAKLELNGTGNNSNNFNYTGRKL